METEGDASCENGISSLELVSVIGFEGKILGGLISHPDGNHIIYGLGCRLIIKNLATNQQKFLTGHSNNVSCLNVSSSGQYLASGQMTHMGFKADVIVWNFSDCSIHCRLSLHKVHVQAVAFSPNERFLATLGGHDDNTVVVWNLETKRAVCGNQAAMSSAGMVHALSFSKCRDDIFVTGGDGTLRVWELRPEARKIIPTECNLGQLKRVVKYIQLSNDDQYMYCGTTSGDILEVNITTYLIQNYGPMKNKFSQGVISIQLLPSGNFLLGTGGGLIVEASNSPNFKKIRSTKLQGKVTSLSQRGTGHQFFVGLGNAQMYKMDFKSFTPILLGSCHESAITSIVFPRDSSELFATSSRNDVRVWHADTGKELLRLTVANLTCHAVDITPNGKAIITAWDDGKIRAYYPESGNVMYTIHDAHNKGVTALATTSVVRRQLISGGGEGQVRIWEVTPKGHTTMKEALKEHKGAVTCIKITASEEECVTSSTDGTCIIWDLVRFVRNQIIFANTMFRSVCYRPDECQIITVGTDRKIGYWETYDGSQIRELEGSKSASINGMDIHGTHFVTGGGDKLIKMWRYDEGDVTHFGVGHSGEITAVKISPDGQHIVSVSADGAILRWSYPTMALTTTDPEPLPEDIHQQPEVGGASPGQEAESPRQEVEVGGVSSREK